MSKQHYQVSTYRAQSSIGYLVKRAHSLMLDVMEPLLEERGFTFVQYVILSWLRDGIAVNPKTSVSSIATTAAHSRASSTNWRRAAFWNAYAAIAIGAKWSCSSRRRAAKRSSASSPWSWTNSTWRWPISAAPRCRNSIACSSSSIPPCNRPPSRGRRQSARTPEAAMHLKALLLMRSLAFPGCVLPPKEAPPPRTQAHDTVGLTGVAAEPAADGWWDSFQDPQLGRLIRLGLKDSPTLTQAQARVGAALAQAQSAQAAAPPPPHPPPPPPLPPPPPHTPP